PPRRVHRLARPLCIDAPTSDCSFSIPLLSTVIEPERLQRRDKPIWLAIGLNTLDLGFDQRL
ncbi:hypothetical protein PUNSTDRAFT_120782, partial [Punctularia strigosozonata HHB-11173 SS5]|uniref:uncharacterized protein n=1 Tax=Punctularia strigosozonata (strain HHB-11173) TaxID=741275 RepID=UPI0004418307